MSNKSGTSSQVISLPKGGGALHGIGETFSPDLFTGTGNFTVPIALPLGRNSFQPELKLVYSSGNGNGPFGLGWNLTIPGVSRKTSKGIPRYDDSQDIFILSGAEDLVPVAEERAESETERRITTQYRPRTEGLFARIYHHHIVPLPEGSVQDYWEVRSKDGLVSYYGTPTLPANADSNWQDTAVIADPSDRSHIFSWSLTQTRDPFGNLILYDYDSNAGKDGPHHWDQLYLKQIRYGDYGNDRENPEFLVSVTFQYEDELLPDRPVRPDPFSEYRSGFEIRTCRRCQQIDIRTHADQVHLSRSYQFIYLDQRQDLANLEQIFPLNGVSLLSQVKVVGHDGDVTENLPPLEFGYTRFEPEGRDFFPVEGQDLPARSLGNPGLELADLFGNGLPDILEMNGTVRYWRNLGNGRFDLPREMKDAPAGLSLADPSVQLLDANGDGRIDLLVNRQGLSGYFPLQFGGLWDRKSFQRYETAPSFDLQGSDVQLVDLTGDGVTDAIRSGSRLECFFNDPKTGWEETRWVERQDIEDFPNINFSDPRVKWGDLSGDGLQDILLVYDGNIEYWPNLGYGKWGKRISMRNSPRFLYGYDPRRIIVGDVDGDGLADIVYVDNNKVILWINQSGNGWSDPIEIKGTPPVTDMDAVRLVDLLGTGLGGILWSSDANGLYRSPMYFLDLTGGIKPYLLHEMNNNMGALTRVQYTSSTRYYLDDEKQPETRWQTPLPFPVLVVAQVETIDYFSGSKLTTEYSYHHGYWDGAEREFRGFGRVEHLNTEVFEQYNQAGLHGEENNFARVEKRDFSPPLLTKTWFHLGSVGDEVGPWQEVNYLQEFWAGDEPLLKRSAEVADLLKSLSPRRVKRDALRTLRGQMLRTELYALDGSDLQSRPYTVTESLPGVAALPVGDILPEDPQDWQDWQRRIFFPHTLAQRTTQWERGEEPMTQFSFTQDYDEYGQPRRQTQIACPRGWRSPSDMPTKPYLATRSYTVYAEPSNSQVYIQNRVAKTTTYEITNTTGKTVQEIATLADDNPDLKLIGQTLNFYDGEAFQGLPYSQVGNYGALVRSLTLVMTEENLQEAYGDNRPPYLSSPVNWTGDYPQEFQNQLNQLPDLAGYIFQPSTEFATGYFAIAQQQKYDFQEGGGNTRGLIKVMRDPLKRETSIEYDSYDLLPIKVTDPVGLTTQAKYYYRVLKPRLVTDTNGNETAFDFSPLGLLTATWVRGNPHKLEGDRQRPSSRLEYDFLAFLQSPPERRQPIFVRTIQHIHHDTETDILLPKRDEIIETCEYSDGFGRLLQTRIQGEEVRFGDPVFGGGESVLPAQQSAGRGGNVVGSRNDDPTHPNVVVSGWQSYDNKGQVIEKFEPFFSTGWAYRSPDEERDQFDREVLGQKVTMYYDPRGQIIRTVNPDGSEQRVIYGIPEDLGVPEHYLPTPWEGYTYDANDNAGRTHFDGSLKYQHHWNTPASIVIDALGRTIEAVERNGSDPDKDWYTTRSSYDIRGNLLTVIDPLGRLAFEYVYDLANRPLQIKSLDAGIRCIVMDAAGNELERWDSKRALILQAYDDLNRPRDLWARDGTGQPLTWRQHLIYGDSDEAGLSSDEQNAGNLRGTLYRHYDEAGLVRAEAYDFKGNSLETVRQVIRDEVILAVFPEPGDPNPNWQIQPFQVNWQPGTNWDEDYARTLLEATEHRTSATYDAVDRIKQMDYPEDVTGNRKQLRPQYNRAGGLERVELDGDIYVERIAYDAKGQRVLIVYGNGVMTRYAYDPYTFRLVRLTSDRYSQLDDLTYRLQGSPLQNLSYTYDLVGNILSILDQTPGSGVTNNPDALRFQQSDPPLMAQLQVGDALWREFEYDPLNRLLSATGRACKSILQPRPWTDEPRCGFNSVNHGTPTQDNAPNLTALYRETYTYDPAGNMLELKHQQSVQANGGISWETNWTRNFGMGGLTPEEWADVWPNHVNVNELWDDPPSNRLTHVEDRRAGVTSPPVVNQSHFFDANGNLVQEKLSRYFEWNHSDQLKAFRNQAGTGEPSVSAHYLYDAAGQRVKKLVRKQGQVEVTVYVGGMFELHRLVTVGKTKENNSLHVMDDQSRIAVVLVGEPFESNDQTPVVQYHLGDHLGSSALVIDEIGNWVNREEYTPYGETSFGSFGRKRYRFTGKERDEESGLYYHGARYYSPWLGRWTCCDPMGAKDSSNLFVYVNNNPLKFFDSSGEQSSDMDKVQSIVRSSDPSASALLEGQYINRFSNRRLSFRPVSSGATNKYNRIWQLQIGFETDPRVTTGGKTTPDYRRGRIQIKINLGTKYSEEFRRHFALNSVSGTRVNVFAIVLGHELMHTQLAMEKHLSKNDPQLSDITKQFRSFQDRVEIYRDAFRKIWSESSKNISLPVSAETAFEELIEEKFVHERVKRLYGLRTTNEEMANSFVENMISEIARNRQQEKSEYLQEFRQTWSKLKSDLSSLLSNIDTPPSVMPKPNLQKPNFQNEVTPGQPLEIGGNPRSD